MARWSRHVIRLSLSKIEFRGAVYHITVAKAKAIQMGGEASPMSYRSLLREHIKCRSS
jgi:hypothetical protein